MLLSNGINETALQPLHSDTLYIDYDLIYKSKINTSLDAITPTEKKNENYL
jgi:hypothetical protein